MTLEKGGCIKADHRLGGLIGVFVSILSSSSLERSLNPNHTSFLGHFQTNQFFSAASSGQTVTCQAEVQRAVSSVGRAAFWKGSERRAPVFSLLVARSFFCQRPMRWVFSVCLLTHEILGSNRMGLTSGSIPGVIWGHLATSRDNSDCYNFDVVLLGHCG